MALIERRKCVVVDVGGVKTGGAHPIVVQSMTNTDTADTAATVNQVMALARAGSELVRVTVNTDEAAEAVPKIVETLNQFGVRVPIIGDFHYNGHLLLKKYPECAKALAKYRINPGNVNIGRKTDENFRTMIECAMEYGKPVRIGVNWGSLDQALLARMMDENGRRAEPLEAAEVMKRAIVVERDRVGAAGGELRIGARPDHPEREGVERAGSDRRLPDDGGGVRLSAASGTDGSGAGEQGNRGDDGGAVGAVAGGDRGHDPGVADAAAERGPDGGSGGFASRSCSRWGCGVLRRR